ncbi:LOW QUALITY PROTEIN: auxin-responsive endogenous peptide 1 [Arabidopsis lyrata subsp. lyrata]|nr:LOW QUALITY PROTEIN: auxin-responsive endogenous peptide 1 [Arabidopsis lyrata subsp. lyrata]|eukprot:XP_020870192.1 LOW QUALITY PROTEIN: auxin-responsive endogenous peptide 1 [Arabidopsis lyrata subsp. lyrata]
MDSLISTLFVHCFLDYSICAPRFYFYNKFMLSASEPVF